MLCTAMRSEPFSFHHIKKITSYSEPHIHLHTDMSDLIKIRNFGALQIVLLGNMTILIAGGCFKYHNNMNMRHDTVGNS